LPRVRARPGKRACDFAVAVVLLVLLAPLLVAIALSVRFTSEGGAIYRQTRVGRNRRPFVMYKFRTMRCDATDDVHREYVRRLLTEDAPPTGGSNGLYKLECDPRVTRVGRFLRRTSLDELPQLANVVLGQMSLVGPRPALPWEAELFPANSAPRFLVRPGVTGLWQVSGRSRLPMRAGLDLDIDYVRRQGPWLDLVILVKTLRAVFNADEAS
jgi:lipopolysaccharide/colanic/teichoic acid biosynthesis glycosyltransferase